MDPNLRRLIEAAIRAPSGDNTQPWRFVVDNQQKRIDFQVDETRDTSPMNAGQRMARIAVGAALENALQFSQHSGWSVELVEPAQGALAAIQLRGTPTLDSESHAGEAKLLFERVTNRRMYDGRLLPSETLENLQKETPELDGVRTLWICERERIEQLARLIGRADALMFGEASMRRAFLEKVRFDAPAEAEVEEGLSLASLELAAKDRIALRLMPRAPNWLLRAAGTFRLMASHARKLVKSASGLCLIVAQDNSTDSDVSVGRAMQRAWLATTDEQLAVQPMCSIPVLENTLDNGSEDLIALLRHERLSSLRREIRQHVPEIGDGRPAFLLRFGFAPAPSGRTGRLPLKRAATELVSSSPAN